MSGKIVRTVTVLRLEMQPQNQKSLNHSKQECHKKKSYHQHGNISSNTNSSNRSCSRDCLSSRLHVEKDSKEAKIKRLATLKQKTRDILKKNIQRKQKKLQEIQCDGVENNHKKSELTVNQRTAAHTPHNNSSKAKEISKLRAKCRDSKTVAKNLITNVENCGKKVQPLPYHVGLLRKQNRKNQIISNGNEMTPFLADLQLSDASGMKNSNEPHNPNCSVAVIGNWNQEDDAKILKMEVVKDKSTKRKIFPLNVTGVKGIVPSDVDVEDIPPIKPYRELTATPVEIGVTSIEDPMKEMELVVPNAVLQTKATIYDPSVQLSSNFGLIAKDMESKPDLLSFSSIHNPPYNFMVAVQKKLDAFTKREFLSTHEKKHLTEGQLYKNLDSESMCFSVKPNVAPSFKQQKCKPTLSERNFETHSSRSDTMSNISSIPFKEDSSNDFSQDTAINKECTDYPTSFASTVMVQDNCSHLSKNIDSFSQEAIPSVRDETETLVVPEYLRLRKRSDQWENLEVFLEGFSKSLSQVIDVNQRLHSVLDQTLDSRKQIDGPKSQISYTEDFTNTSSELQASETQNSANSKNPIHSEPHFKDPSFEQKLAPPVLKNYHVQNCLLKKPDFERKPHETTNVSYDNGFEKNITATKTLNSMNTDYCENQNDEIPVDRIIWKATRDMKTRKHFSPVQNTVTSPEYRNSPNFDISATSLYYCPTNCVIEDEKFSYSSLGAVERLLGQEVKKTKYLETLLKTQEKALLDRTRSQITWLEIHKKKLKTKGLNKEINAIRKKQRTILLRMEKERSEIRRLLKSGQKHNFSFSSPSKLNFTQSSKIIVNGNRNLTKMSNSPGKIKCFELNSTKKLETWLKERKQNLNKRKEYIKILMDKRERLEEEEKEVIEMEKALHDGIAAKMYLYQQKRERKNNANVGKMNMLVNINTSLETLKVLNCANPSDEIVKVSGFKLHNLWKRLTGQPGSKYIKNQNYFLSKHDLEQLYEDAKVIVSGEFSKKHVFDLFESPNSTAANISLLSQTRASSCDESKKALELVYDDSLSLNCNNALVQNDNKAVETHIQSQQGNTLPINSNSIIFKEHLTSSEISVSPTIYSNLSEIAINKNTASTDTPTFTETEREKTITKDENMLEIWESTSGQSKSDCRIEENSPNKLMILENIIKNDKICLEVSETVQNVELKRCLIEIDENLRGLHGTIDRVVLSPEALGASDWQQIKNVSKNNKSDVSAVLNNCSLTSQIPDLISEVEVLERTIPKETVKQIEACISVSYLREIPNKPPPPYVPPAHGSPMTTIFPSEVRCRQLAYKQIEEMYSKICKAGKSVINVATSHDDITNVYECIILDICKESFEKKSVSFNDTNYSFIGLGFYNPPNRLQYIQEHIYAKIQHALTENGCRARKPYFFNFNRKKCDHVDEILIEELFEDECNWTNFNDVERLIKLKLVDEISRDIIDDVLKELQ